MLNVLIFVWFNVRSWDLIIDQIAQLYSEYVEKKSAHKPQFCVCSLLVDMYQFLAELTR